MAQAYIIDLGVALGAVPAPAAQSPLDEARVLGFSDSDAVELTDPDARRAPDPAGCSELPARFIRKANS